MQPPSGYLAEIRDAIDQDGWIVQQVGRVRRRAPVAYTVGLTAQDRPELLVTGMNACCSVEMLNGIAVMLLHAGIPKPGERINYLDRHQLEVVMMPQPSVHLDVAVALYGQRIRALQLVWADDEGTWPWEPGHRVDTPAGQPVLGTRALGARALRRTG